MQAMKHYVCRGKCGGVSDIPGTCQAEDCNRHEHELVECSCEDGKHSEVKKEE